MWLFLLIVAVLLGLVLLVVGRRGRRVDTHRLCRRCRYDLSGSDAAAPGGGGAAACPECGADLTHRRAVRVGNRRPRRVLAWSGGVFALLAAGGLGLVLYTGATETDWNPHKPVWLLRWETRNRGTSESASALDELLKRDAAGELPAGQVRSMVNDALAAQGDEARPWDRDWGRLVERERAAGRVGDEAWERYKRQAVVGFYSLEVRPRVQRGKPVLYRLSEGPARLGDAKAFSVVQRDYLLFIDGKRVGGSEGLGSGGPLSGELSSTISGAVEVPAAVSEDMLVGPHRFRYESDTVIKEFDFANLSESSTVRIDGPRIVVEATFEFVAEPTQRVVDDPSLGPEILAALEPDIYGWHTGGRFQLSGNLRVQPVPVGVAFRITARAKDGRFWELARSRVAAGDHGNWSLTDGKFHDPPAPDRVDLIFSPDIEGAESDTDLETVWNGALRIEDVEVSHH